ncbi:hypothetical protein B0E53_00427 [Micromonospora sp. MH33]|uniref:hypothetical protein n=1 Tax=Micromonospora sp. MH33 TaxID=1945509 RepID=UPI000D14BEF7|nr:hypothetical protein [Micromonospora sp. MH33]PSK67617.1 hypothetical protein B0E53_00427 [Micromonospora sp. MH33]
MTTEAHYGNLYRQSLFYRPASTWLTTLRAYTGGPTPARPDDPAIRFHPEGIAYHYAYGYTPILKLGWPAIRAIALLPGPIPGRKALCIYRLNPPPPPTPKDPFSGTGHALGSYFHTLFGTNLAVHLHHVRGPSLKKLARRLPEWTNGRLTLTTTRPT